MIDQSERWRRSTFSGQGNECVEVSNKGRVRDSKHSGGASLEPVSLANLYAAAKAGRLDC